MKFRLFLYLFVYTSLSQPIDKVSADDAEIEWRAEAQSVATDALEKKYLRIVTPEAHIEIYRYSAASVLERTAHSFSFIITPDKSKANMTYRCDIIVSRYRGQVYSFIFGEPTCYQVECTKEDVPYQKAPEKFCRKLGA